MGEDMRSDKRLLGSANSTVITVISPYISEYNCPSFLRCFFFHHHHRSFSKGFFGWRDGRKRRQRDYL